MQRAESREQSAEGIVQRTESREQRAEDSDSHLLVQVLAEGGGPVKGSERVHVATRVATGVATRVATGVATGVAATYWSKSLRREMDRSEAERGFTWQPE